MHADVAFNVSAFGPAAAGPNAKLRTSLPCALSGHLFPCDLELIGLRNHGPYFNCLTKLETGAVSGYLHGLVKIVCLNEKVACDRFLRFCKRAVPYDSLAGKRFTGVG